MLPTKFVTEGSQAYVGFETGEPRKRFFVSSIFQQTVALWREVQARRITATSLAAAALCGEVA